MWPHMSQSEKDSIAPLVAYLSKLQAATAPPMIGEHELTEEMMEDDVSIPDEEDKSLWGTYLANCQGASGVEELYNNCDNDEYVIYDFYSQTLLNCLIGPSVSKLERISAEDCDV